MLPLRALLMFSVCLATAGCFGAGGTRAVDGGRPLDGGGDAPNADHGGAVDRAAFDGGGGSGGGASTDGGNGGDGSGGTSAPSGPRVADFLGLNGFIDDDKARLAAVGNVREYHNWTWNDGNGAAGYPGYPNNQLAFSLFNGFWDFDDYYGKLHQAGVLVLPCIQGSVDYLKNALPPVAAGADVASAASYAAHASFMYQYAARYGATAVPVANLKLAAGQTARTGLGLLTHFENGNEPDANWVKPDGSYLFSPEATAAMSSADYDGDQGRLGPTFGVKRADPGAKMVLAGLAGAGRADWLTNVTTYLDGMRAWAAAHRGGSFPADVINVHEYCFGPDPFGTANPRPALAPEPCGLQALLAGVASYRDRALPGKEIWLTEFGYDTHPRSRLRAPAIAGASAEVVQGQWLVRSFLALMASGIDRAFLFVARDSCTGTDAQCPDNAIQFATSGVLTQKGEEAPKAAWYFLATVRARLGSMRYLGTAAGAKPNVSVARFHDAASGAGAYVAWMTTSDGSTTAGYPLPLAAAVTRASIVTLQPGSATGAETAATVTAGTVTLTVTETPQLVLVNARP